MSAAFDDLIKQPEPRTLLALHAAKVIVLLAALASAVVGAVAFVLGFKAMILLYAFLALLPASLVIALLANRLSQSLFARRAADLGLDEDDARRFWRTHDWDQPDA